MATAKTANTAVTGAAAPQNATQASPFSPSKDQAKAVTRARVVGALSAANSALRTALSTGEADILRNPHNLSTGEVAALFNERYAGGFDALWSHLEAIAALLNSLNPGSYQMPEKPVG